MIQEIKKLSYLAKDSLHSVVKNIDLHIFAELKESPLFSS